MMKYVEINPTTLRIGEKLLADAEILSILENNDIDLKLNVFDSCPEDEEKPVLVLLHGNSSSSHVFMKQIAEYEEHYRVIAIDLIGHGGSSKLIEFPQLSIEEKEKLGRVFYCLPAMVAEIAQVLQEKQIKDAHFIGWSLGGHIAYGVAIEAPELVASIISIGSPPVRFSSDGLRKGFSDWFVTTLVPQWVTQVESTSAGEALAIRHHMGFDETDTFFTEDMMKTDPLVRRHLFLKTPHYNSTRYDNTPVDAASFVLATSIPICLLVGENDKGIHNEVFAALSGKLKNEHSVVCIIPNGQHALFKTNPDEYHAVVNEFLESVTAHSLQQAFRM